LRATRADYSLSALGAAFLAGAFLAGVLASALGAAAFLAGAFLAGASAVSAGAASALALGAFFGSSWVRGARPRARAFISALVRVSALPSHLADWPSPSMPVMRSTLSIWRWPAVRR